jgi:hypothetical protein
MAKKKEWNFLDSDVEDMTPINKGEILYHHKMGKKPKEIAGITGRSMDWIKNIIGALWSWRKHSELIDEYLEDLQEREGMNDAKTGKAAKKEVVGGISSGVKSRSNKTGTSERTAKQVSTRRTKGRRAKSGRSGLRPNRSKNTNKQGLADTLRKAKDYKGE